MKKILLIGFCLLLTGCFGSDSETQYKVQKFRIQASVFEVLLPETWAILEPNNDKNEIFIGQKNDQNFIILHQNQFHNDIPSVIIENLEKNFFSFSLLEQNELEWHFEGKLSAEKPTREFYQKIVPIPDSTEFLLGSCSFEPYEDRLSDCVEISKRWGLSAETE